MAPVKTALIIGGGIAGPVTRWPSQGGYRLDHLRGLRQARRTASAAC